ncbi:MAG: class I SAM-dependent methyltransferase [Anaerolineae bacterium]|nr:class I SAM-dependent methyltransferase [Anaerolineae bacterium]
MPFPHQVKLEHRPCPLGCQPDDELVLVAHDRLRDLPGEFPVVRCRTCGLMRTNPRPTPETIGYYYPEDYGPHVGTRIAPRVNRDKPIQWWKYLRRHVFEFNTERLPLQQPGRMLEIGSASGVFLHQMALRGWHVQGIEFAKGPAGAALDLGYAVHIGRVETAPDPIQPYDLIVGWMVLEHLHEPVTALRKLHGWLAPDGWLVLSIPNAASLEFRLFRNDWYALQAPTHLYHYTPATLGQLLGYTDWYIERLFHHRVLNNLPGSLGHVLQRYGLHGRLTTLLVEFPERAWHVQHILYPIAFLMAAFGQTGRMTVWARKRSEA